MSAQEPLVTDRPDFTESASVVGAGRWQLEAGVTLSGSDGTQEWALGELLVRIGAGSRVEVRVAGNSYLASEEDGELEDPGLGAKLLVTDGTALLVSSTLDDWKPEVRLAHARTLGGLSWGANVGWFLESVAGARRHGVLASVTAGIPLGPRRSLFFETYGVTRQDPGGDEAYVDGGITHLVSDDFQLDARVGAGLAGSDAADWYVGVGAARRW